MSWRSHSADSAAGLAARAARTVLPISSSCQITTFGLKSSIAKAISGGAQRQ